MLRQYPLRCQNSHNNIVFHKNTHNKNRVTNGSLFRTNTVRFYNNKLHKQQFVLTNKLDTVRFYSSKNNSDNKNEKNNNVNSTNDSNTTKSDSTQSQRGHLDQFEKEQEEMMYGSESETPKTEQESRIWFSKLQSKKRQKLRKKVHERILKRGGKITPEEFHKELENLYQLYKMDKDWGGHLHNEDKKFKKQLEKRARSWLLFSIVFILFLLVLYQWENQLYMENAELIMDLLGDTRPERRVAAYEAASKFLLNGAAVLTVMKQPFAMHNFSNDPMEEYDNRKDNDLTMLERTARKIYSWFQWYKPNLQPILEHQSSSRSFPHTIEEFAQILMSGIIDTDSRVRHAARKLLCQGASSYARFEESLVRNGVLTQLLDNLSSSQVNSSISQKEKQHSKSTLKTNDKLLKNTIDQDALDSRISELFQQLLHKEEHKKYLLNEPDFLNALARVAKTSSAIINSQNNPLTNQEQLQNKNEDKISNYNDDYNQDLFEAELTAMMKPYSKEDNLSLARFKLELVMSVLIEFVSSADLFPKAISDIKFQRTINHLSMLDIPSQEGIETPDVRRLRQLKRAAQLMQNFEPSGNDYSAATEKLNEVFSFSNIKTELNSHLQAIDMPSNLVRLFARDVSKSLSSDDTTRKTNVMASGFIEENGSHNNNNNNDIQQLKLQGDAPDHEHRQKAKPATPEKGTLSHMIASIREQFASSGLLKLQWGYALFCIPLSFFIARRRFMREKISFKSVGISIRYWLLISAVFPFRELWHTSYGVEYANAVNVGYIAPHAVGDYHSTNKASSPLLTHIGVGLVGTSLGTLTDLLALRTALQAGSILYSAPYWLLFPVRLIYDDRQPIRLNHLLTHAYFTKTNPFRIKSTPKE